MRAAFALLTLIALSGCATNFESQPLPPDHPASVQAQEAPRSQTKRLLGTDELTHKTNAQLARREMPSPDFQNSGMSHDMSSMEGMDHSGMQGMDHSKMKGMTPPAAIGAATPASKEAMDMEMKKTSDEMKKLSDELKARSDATEKAEGKSASTEASPVAAIYTCVMHPEIQQNKPGDCPKCGMTLVKKQGASK